MRLLHGRQPIAGLFHSLAAAAFASSAAIAGAAGAASADGRFRLDADDGAGVLVVREGATGQELRRIPLVDRQRRPGRLAWILDLPRRQSFLAAFESLPEAWELPYGDKAEPVYDGLVHDYRMGEGIAERGPLPVRRIPLAAPLPRPTPDGSQNYVAWADPTRPGGRSVLNLDVRRVVALADAPRIDLPGVDEPSPTVPDAVARADAPAAQARATAQPAAEAVPRIEAVQVIAAASRVEESVDTVPATVSVIDRTQVFQEVAANLRDLLRYEPGVSVENGATRFGLGNLSIRGLDGNRVQMTVDGIRLPESYRVGSFSNASRNALGLGLLQRVEIVRGPASAIHGSDALAGVVAFTTLDPAAYLRGGATLGGEAFAGYATADGSLARGGALAVAAGASQFLVGAERADGSEMENQGVVGGTGNARTEPNPQSTRSESQLAKWRFTAPSGWRYGLTAERHARDVATDVLSLNPQSPRTASLQGDDRSRRTRVSADAAGYGVGPLGHLSLTAYRQDSLTQQDTAELRVQTTAACLSAAGSIRCLREPRFRYETAESGIVAIGTAQSPWGGLPDKLVLGLEFARAQLSEMRDGRQTILDTGTVSSVVGGEPLPTRDFPRTTTDRLGAFVQDSLDTAGGRLTWVPGLRFDAYRIRPEPDEAFRVGRPAASLSDQALSPKLGVLFRSSEMLTWTGQLAAGFRAPPAADLNIGLSSLPAGYAVIPNPDLQSETSRGAEAGVRVKTSTVEALATIYYTRYADLIVSRAALPCPADPQCVPGATGTFQSRNVSSARIYGAEAKAAWRFEPGWTLRGALSAPRGDDTARDAPLNSIDPAQLVVGLARETAGWGAAAHVTHAWPQDRVDPATAPAFRPPAWTTADLTAWVKPMPGLEVAAGVFNLTDRKYWLWSDVRALTTVTTGFDRYTQPGRHYGLNARWRF